MTHVPLELPVQTGEAAVLAELILEHAVGRKLNDGIRNRIGTRLSALRLTSFEAFAGSLQRDPVHPSSYYMVVEAAGSRLLRVALASSPSSGLFPNSLLIGRLRTASGREVVVNAIPFSVEDREQIRVYAEKVDREFLPRVTGAVPVLAVYAQMDSAEGVWGESVWRAIRAGWREGWSAVLAVEGSLDGVRGRALAGDFTRFSMAPGEEALRAHAFVRGVRRQFDFELDLTGAAEETTADEIAGLLRDWRAQGKPVQSIAPRLEREPRETFESRLRVLHDAARQGNALLSLEGRDEVADRVTGGRVHYRSPEFLRP